MSTTSSNDTTSEKDIEYSSDNTHIPHVKKRKKIILLMLMHAANYSLNYVIKTPRRTSTLIDHD